MKLKDFEQLLSDKRYIIEDNKYPNAPFTRFNHLICNNETGRRFLTIRIKGKDDEIGFIEVYE